MSIDAFSPTPPHWTQTAVHARQFCCPRCGAASSDAIAAWINRRAPVYTENHQRKWQEFYACKCEAVWWAWSADRPPSPFAHDDDDENDDDEADQAT